MENATAGAGTISIYLNSRSKCNILQLNEILFFMLVVPYIRLLIFKRKILPVGDNAHYAKYCMWLSSVVTLS